MNDSFYVHNTMHTNTLRIEYQSIRDRDYMLKMKNLMKKRTPHTQPEEKTESNHKVKNYTLNQLFYKN